MPTVDSHAPGTFCWLELGTTDAASARPFYNKLFGWETAEQPMGEGACYTLFKISGRDIAGGYDLMPEQRQQGVPPHWMLYFAVANVDEALAKAKAAGGTVLMGPMDVWELGRMAVVRDPQGAVFSIWQAKQHAGTGISGEVGAPCWAELEAADTAAARAFYEAVFGWGAKVSPEYTEWTLDGKEHAGMKQIAPEWGPVPPHWLPYFLLKDCDAAVVRAGELGGKACVPPMDIPNVGRIAVLNDPQGAAFAVIAPTAFC
jgi:predicted enzyme related to lactoylglutathione lyase